MTRFLSSLAGKLIAAGLVLALVAFGVTQCRNARNSRSEANLSAEMGKAVSDSAADAIDAVGGVSGRNTATDQTTRENADAIRNAPGADARLDPALDHAGRVGLCRRAAYRGSPDCVQFTPAGDVAGAGAGRAAPGK